MNLQLTRFAIDKRAHYELIVLVLQVIVGKNDLDETVLTLTSKWKHLLPTPDNFHSELGNSTVVESPRANP